MTSKLNAALAYAQILGWAVLPLHTPIGSRCSCGKPDCDNIGKHPRTENGVHNATKVPDLIRAWWRKWPDANIGIATGQVSGVVVLDVDGPEGEEALAEICGNPPTPTSLTGKGRHAFFAAPEFKVKNAVALTPKLDVRGDGGYVVAPPSKHASGTVYTWDRENGLGPRDLSPPPLPPALADRLKASVQTTLLAPISDTECIKEGGRNDTLTRYTGRLFRLGHKPEEVMELVRGVNATKCTPPLPDQEVQRIVSSIAAKEQQNGDRELDGDEMAQSQVADAIEYGRRDYSMAPKWGWGSLHRLVGPVLPGELWIVGARPAQGKTTFLLNWMEHLAEMQAVPWLFVGMEMDPKQLRRKWSAFRCGLDEEAVLTSAWQHLPDDAQQRIEEDLQEQASHLGRLAHFAPARRIDPQGLRKWIEFAVSRDCKAVVVDHLHRMTFPGQGDARPLMAEAVREAKEMAVTHDISLVCAAQLNRGGRDVFSAYQTQPLEALRECGAIEEEADVVLMLSRMLKDGIGKGEMTAVREGQAEIEDLIAVGGMRVTCQKHRRNGGMAQSRHAILHLDEGLLRERIQIA